MGGGFRQELPPFLREPFFSRICPRKIRHIVTPV